MAPGMCAAVCRREAHGQKQAQALNTLVLALPKLLELAERLRVRRGARLGGGVGGGRLLKTVNQAQAKRRESDIPSGCKHESASDAHTQNGAYHTARGRGVALIQV